MWHSWRYSQPQMPAVTLCPSSPVGPPWIRGCPLRPPALSPSQSGAARGGERRPRRRRPAPAMHLPYPGSRRHRAMCCYVQPPGIPHLPRCAVQTHQAKLPLPQLPPGRADQGCSAQAAAAARAPTTSTGDVCVCQRIGRETSFPRSALSQSVNCGNATEQCNRMARVVLAAA